VLKDTVAHLAKSLGYVLLPRWALSHPQGAELFDSLGYYVVPKSRAWAHWGTLHLRKLFELLRIDCVLDVGANAGQYRDFLRDHVGFTGLVISFEPIPEHVRVLQERAKSDANWVIQGCALGRASGESELNVMARSEFSSFLAPRHADGEFLAENRLDHRVTVPMEALDEVLPSIERQRHCERLYLKLDTQGFDLEVAKGGTRTLARTVALQTEASVIPLYEGMPDYVTTIRTFECLGFDLSGIFPNHDGNFPRLIEFDAVMIRRTPRRAA
jgi:FkbM family methyltransferase